MQIYSRHLCRPLLFHRHFKIKLRAQSKHQLLVRQADKSGVLIKRCLQTGNTVGKSGGSQRLLYAASFVVGTSLGLVFGYLYNFTNAAQMLFLRSDQDTQAADKSTPSFDETAGGFTRMITNTTDSAYSKFPLRITVYQFATSPYSSQLRGYLDYFGFNYTCVEVDPSTKAEVRAITRRPQIPIVTLEHENSQRKWYLTNSTTILSVFETLRNDYDLHADAFTESKYLHDLIKRYLPTLTNEPDALKFPNKYLIENYDDNLNDIEWRKWINNTAMPVIRWNSVDSLQHVLQLVDVYQLKSQWSERFDPLKRIYLYYSFASKLYREKKAFRNNVAGLDPNSFSTPTEALDAVIETWQNSLQKTSDNQHEFHGKNGPNLADISLYGIMRVFDGCELYAESMQKHERFLTWFKNMEKLIEANDGVKQQRHKQTVVAPASDSKKQQDDEAVAPSVATNHQLILRVLSLTYLIHVFAFTYAAACRSSS